MFVCFSLTQLLPIDYRYLFQMLDFNQRECGPLVKTNDHLGPVGENVCVSFYL